MVGPVMPPVEVPVAVVIDHGWRAVVDYGRRAVVDYGRRAVARLTTTGVNDRPAQSQLRYEYDESAQTRLLRWLRRDLTVLGDAA